MYGVLTKFLRADDCSQSTINLIELLFLDVSGDMSELHGSFRGRPVTAYLLGVHAAWQRVGSNPLLEAFFELRHELA